METKASIVKRLVDAGKYKEAMKIAKGFTRDITVAEKDIITRAFECYGNARFYISLGINPDTEIEKGIEIMKKVYAS